MTGTRPQVSVVIPARNAAAHVPRLLAALSAQTVPRESFEIVVVDDGSQDGTARAAERGGLARVERLSARGGRSAARNRGVALARGEIVAFTDADCEPARTWIERGIAAFADPGVDIAVGRVDIPLERRPPLAALLDAARHLDQESYASAGFGATANLWVRSEVLARTGDFNPHLIAGEDAELCLRAQATGARLSYRDDVVVVHPPRRKLRQLAAKAFRMGVAAAQQRRHARGTPQLLHRPAAQGRLYVPHAHIDGAERLQSLRQLPGPARRIALSAVQYLFVQLPLVAGDLGGTLVRAAGSDQRPLGTAGRVVRWLDRRRTRRRP